MRCAHVKLPNGLTAIVCGSGRAGLVLCVACDRRAPFLCDWKLGGGKTCDVPICAAHAEPVAEDKHLCPKHSKVWAQWQAERALRSASTQDGTA